jgi:hypothetical protein
MALDSGNQLWGATSDNSPTAPDSLVRINPLTALVTVVGSLNAPSGGTAADLAFETDGTLIGWFTGAGAYGTVNTSTGQVTLLTGPGVPAGGIGGIAVTQSPYMIGPFSYATGAVFSVSASSVAGSATLRLFHTITNTENSILSLTGDPCCTFTALEILGPTIYALAGGSLLTITIPSGGAAVAGPVPAGVVSLSFALAPPVTVSVAPPTASLSVNQTQTFTATVGGTFNTTVTWSIPGGAPGSINPNTGVYTAPPTIAAQQNVTVTATSQADPTKTGTATVTLTPVSLTVSPSTATLYSGQTQQFTATVTGSSNTAVTWSIPAGAPGSINASTGLYTAPANITSQQNVTVTATSQADSTKTATATVTLALVSITVAPPTATLNGGQTQQFTATVTGSSNTAVTWSIPAGAPGSINASTGLYTAPANITSQQNVTVTATSQADSTKTATATVTLALVSITVAPPTVTLSVSQTQLFTATVSGSSNTAVTWSIPAGAPGSINAGTGLYTAPAAIASQQNVTVTATSQADPTKTATATVTLALVSITAAPSTATLNGGQTQQFTATVIGSSNTAVTWSIPAGAPGSINAGSGLYTAPATVASQQNVTVTATSQADSTKTATATITLTPVSVTVSPGTVTLFGGQSQQFTATVSGSSNTAVTWSVPAGTPGSISTTGLYTAAATVPYQTVIVTATSQADPTKTATATVTLSPPISTVPAPPSVWLAAIGLVTCSLMALAQKLSARHRA